MTDNESPKETLDRCNNLAWRISKKFGFDSPHDYPFYRAKPTSAKTAWSIAVMAYEHILDVDIEGILEGLTEAGLI